MHCPRDGSELTTTEIKGISVQICESDSGLFLDRGELDKITEPTAGDLEYSTVDMDTFDHHDKYGPISCPRDISVQMKKVNFNILTDIILDWCPECGGFWIDGKDLPRINEVVKRLNEANNSVSEPFYIRLAEFFWNLPFPR